ncbi:alpha/beta hydrolase [Pseudomonas helleri]|uniref:Alpha/beta hydrolase n=1 Tax=Pseudomonas helleri TaxID=1608996 RepID=A0A6I1WU30_9PSED|nr:alpha/beta hydrolase [Pseudomonas helleri]MQT72817.1 alpha/beta hydrolase [Pseudomonas helleri]MQU42382.1 alpha/beta hydrolase [Pseudomonas helleri]
MKSLSNEAINPEADEVAVQAAKSIYHLGATTVYSHTGDNRFAYTLYVPESIEDPDRPIDLVVSLHGSTRAMEIYRNGFAEFGRWNDCVILSPLFPVGVLGDGNGDGYKQIIEGDIRYDHVLLDMVASVARKYNRSFDTFALFGYSGGGQFTHRFCYLHPQRLWAASIGAPGSVTLLDADQDWWVGVRNFETRFGKPLDLQALRQVPVHMVVGEADLETWEITHREGGKHYMPGANGAGRTRPERLAALKASFEAAGVKVRFDVLPNVPHQGIKAMPAAQDFFAEVLRTRRSQR